MVETITPVVHGSRRRWIVALLAHTLGATVAAAAFGAALGAFGAALGAPWGAAGPGLVAAVAGAYVLADLAGRPLPVPQARRQVPEWWRTFFGPFPAAALYGAGLGIGFATYLRGGALVAVTVAATASGRPLAAAVVLGAFGAARGASVVVVGRARTSEDVASIAERVASVGASWVPHVAQALSLVAVGTFALFEALNAPSADLAGLATAVLSIAMGWAASAKLARPARWRATLRAYGLGPLEGPTALVVPAAELAVVALALAREPRAAAALGLGLLVAFSVAAVRARIRTGAAVPCGCFGSVRARPIGEVLLRNAALAAVAAIVLIGAGGGRATAFDLSATGGEVVPIALLIVGVVGVAILAVRVRALAQGKG